MPKAVWKDVVLADSDKTVVLEGNHYFPPDAVRWELLIESPTTSRCFWKGRAQYLSIILDDDANLDAAWHYAKPWPLARRIAAHVAFWRGVRIVD